MKKITIRIGSATYAIKARNALLRQGIKVRVIKLDPGVGSEGCTHGLEIYEEQLYSVVSVLREKNINYRLNGSL